MGNNRQHKVKLMLVLFLMVLTLNLISCRENRQSAAMQPEDQEKLPAAAKAPERETAWTWRQIGPEKADINQIQITMDGEVYFLAEGKLYCVQQDGITEIGPQGELTVFHIIEHSGEQMLFTAEKDGNIYFKKGEAPWNKRASPVVKGFPVSAIASDSNRKIVYIGQSTKEGGGLWKSQDEGDSWEKLTDITVRSVVVHPDRNDYLYIVDKAAYSSQDGGRDWKKIETPANYGILIDPQDSGNVLLAYSKGIVYASPDGTVKYYTDFKLPGALSCLELNFSRLGEWAAAAWDYPSGSGGLYLSLDKGETWFSKDETMDKIRILDLRFDHKNDLLYLGTAGHGLWALNLRTAR